jgi:hypothetical protein
MSDSAADRLQGLSRRLPPLGSLEMYCLLNAREIEAAKSLHSRRLAQILLSSQRQPLKTALPDCTD